MMPLFETLVFELPQFSYSLKKQSRAPKKIYAGDLGLLNAVSFKFSEDKGRLLENLVFLELTRKKSELYYYKTGNGLEVDFLIKEKTKAKSLIQVAWDLADKKTRDREIKALIEAMNELNLNQGMILTDNERESLKSGSKKIIIKPVYQWLLEN